MISTDANEITVQEGKEMNMASLVEKCLYDYSRACTTCIIALAAEECGRLGYDPDRNFDKDDIMDPEFPLTIGDDEGKLRPEEILEGISHTRVENIVETLGNMEKSWSTLSPFKEGGARELWEFSKDLACHHIMTLYGEGKQEEFSRMGDELFG